MRSFGFFLLLCGFVLMVGAFFFPVTIEPDALAAQNTVLAAIKGMTEDEARPVLEQAWATQAPVANLDKMALRTMFEIAAATLTIVGALFAAAGTVKAGMNRPTPST